MDNQVTRQAQLSDQEFPDPHRTIEPFALFDENGNNVFAEQSQFTQDVLDEIQAIKDRLDALEA